MKTLLNSLVIVFFLIGCTPDLFEHRSAMVADQTYQQYGLPQKYILGVDDKGTDVTECEISINSNSNYWMQMSEMSNSLTTNYPSGYKQYYMYLYSNLDGKVISVNYHYRCEHKNKPLFPYQTKNTYLGPFVIEKPIWLSWKEESATQWNPSYNENLANNVIIENEGCYDPVHLQNPALRLRTIESYFSIRNDANYRPLYITPFPTIIDLNTGQVTEHGDYFLIQPLGSPSYSNNNIMLNQNEEVQFRLDYHVTVAGMGPIVDSIKIHFFFGESATDLNRNFNIGADLRFEFAGVGNLCPE
jgi:hypothetical protein